MGVALVNLVFIVLEVVVLAFQGFFFFSRIKTRTVRRFLALNLLFIAYNILSGFVLEHFSEFPSLIVYSITSVLLVASVGYYCAGFLKTIKSYRSISISLIASISLALITSYFLNDLSLDVEKIIPVALPLSLMAVTTVYFSRFVKTYEQGVIIMYIITATIVVINLVSFTVYFKDSPVAQSIIINSLFVIIAIFHHLALFRKLHRVIVAKGHVPEDTVHARLVSYGLTKRQIEIAKLVLEGYSSREIAEQCSIETNTVTSHVCKINDKVGVASRKELREHFASDSLGVK